MAQSRARVGAFKEAVAYFRSLVPRTQFDVEQLEQQDQDMAFTVAGVAQVDLVTQVWQAIDQALANGTSFEDFKRTVGEDLANAWGGDKPYRLDTIFRTNVQTAYNAGRWLQMTDPEVAEIRPFFRYLAILDTRTTVLICRPLANTVLPQSDPFWGSHWPPLHFSCRSTVLSLTDTQADEIGRTRRAPLVLVQGGFGATPDERGYVPDMDASPPQLVHAYKTR